MRIAVTGSSGTLGRAAVAELHAGGHDVLGLDLHGAIGPGFTRVDLADYGQTVDAFTGITARHHGLDAVVHLAAIPVNGIVPDVTTFQRNQTVTFNVLFAAMRTGIGRIVFASSINAMGYPFAEAPPVLPVDETYRAANNSYGLGKLLEETAAAQLTRWDARLRLTALRFTNVVQPGGYAGFARAGDPAYRRDLLWSYVDVRDAARAIALALGAQRTGFEVFNITAADTGLSIPSRELAAAAFPGVAVGAEVEEFGTLVSIAKARHQLGYRPVHAWRDELILSRPG